MLKAIALLITIISGLILTGNSFFASKVTTDKSMSEFEELHPESFEKNLLAGGQTITSSKI